MGIFSSDEEPSWSDVYNLQKRNTILELRIDKLRTCLQDIKGIATALYMNEWLQRNETAKQSIQLLREKIEEYEAL